VAAGDCLRKAGATPTPTWPRTARPSMSTMPRTGWSARRARRTPPSPTIARPPVAG